MQKFCIENVQTGNDIKDEEKKKTGIEEEEEEEDDEDDLEA